MIPSIFILLSVAFVIVALGTFVSFRDLNPIWGIVTVCVLVYFTVKMSDFIPEELWTVGLHFALAIACGIGAMVASPYTKYR